MFKRNGCLHIKMKSPLSNPQSTPPTLIPSLLHSSQATTIKNLVCILPFQNHFKNIHTYMYPLLIYSTAFCEASLIQIYKNVMVLDGSYYNFISSLLTFLRSFSVIHADLICYILQIYNIPS